MTTEENLTIQLYGTSDLCFNKDDFLKDGFCVDSFVRVHQTAGSSGLETLRDDLGIYLKILRSAMIELINRDYADFVNLSTNLTGLDRLIEALKTPLGQLREEVLSVQKLLDDAISTTSGDLEKRYHITRQKSVLQRLTQISHRLDRLEALLKSGGNGESDSVGMNSSVSEQWETEGSAGSELVDRLAAEVNHLNFLVAQCEGAALLDVFKPRVSWLCSYVEAGLERGLREGVLKKNLVLLRRTLRTCASLGNINQAHSLVRSLVKLQLEDVVSETALKSDPRGLPGMYNNILAAVNTVCQPLLSVTCGLGPDIVRGYSFLENAAWPEVVSSLDTRTQHIFSPGNPAAFHKRYCETMDFLESFEKHLITRQRVEAFRELPDYARFMDQWNLPVYFQIRYHEISQVVESSLCEDCNGVVNDASSESLFMARSSQVVWDSLLRCYSNEVFLPPLLHRFWKLTLLILARHRTWLGEVTEKLKANKPSMITKERSPGPQGTLNQVIGEKSKPLGSSVMIGLKAAVSLVHDIQVLSNKIPELYEEALKPLLAHLDQDKIDLIKDTLIEEGNKQSALTAGLTKVIEEILISSTSAPLNQVADTPRLYRRTNRSPPTSHQPYVNNSTSVFVTFANDTKSNIKKKVLVSWLTVVCTSVSEKYYTLTYEVLSSVHKMEESLRRLKRARDRGIQPGVDASSGLSDDDKIRLQISLDVEYFGQQMESVWINTSNVESYSKLLSMVHSARDGKFVP